MSAGWRIAIVLAACSWLVGCRNERAAASDPIGEMIGKDVSGLRLHRAEDRGHELFAAYCLTCHGESGAGDGQNASRLDPRPPDLRNALRARGPEYSRRVIESGTAALGRSPLCPPRSPQLSPDQIDSLMAYVERLARERRAPVPRDVTGPEH